MLLTSYLWGGGCVSCEQFFMMPGTDGDCCHHGKCERRQGGKPSSEQTGKDCDRMALNQARSADTDLQIAAAFASQTAFVIEPVIVPEVLRASTHRFSYFDPVADSPPDLSILHNSLLL